MKRWKSVDLLVISVAALEIWQSHVRLTHENGHEGSYDT